MDISRSYSVVISGATSLPKKTLQNTVDCYRRAVGYFIDVILANWDDKFTSDMTQVKSDCTQLGNEIGLNQSFNGVCTSLWYL